MGVEVKLLGGPKGKGDEQGKVLGAMGENLLNT